MQQLEASGQPIDIIAVRVLLTQSERSESPERIVAELGSLMDDRWIVGNLGFYVQIVRKKAALRQIIENSSNIIQLAHSEPDDIQELVALTEKQVAALHGHCADLKVWGFPLRTWDLSKTAMDQAAQEDWLVEPLIAPPDVVTLVGDGGFGKSKLAAAAALSVAFGKPFWGHFLVREPGRVVYINEERPDLTRRHLHTLAPFFEINPAEIEKRIVLIGRGQQTWRVTDPAACHALTRLIKQLGDVVLVVWDSLHVLHDKEENDNAQMTAAIEGFRRICLDAGCCGLILHHTNKNALGDSGQSARGASAIKDTVDAQLLLRRPKGDVPAELRVSQDKTRRALVAPFLLRLDHDESGDLRGITWSGKAPTKADQALETVLEVILSSPVPIRSGEVALKLAAKLRKETVYAALKLIRERNLAPWRKSLHGAFIYGGKPDAPAE